jgi:long-chain acyl-CoA synthetase
MSVPDLLQSLRAHDGDSPALTLLSGLKEEFRWTYRQLLEASQGFRAALQAAGAGPGNYVCLIADNSPQFVALFLACLEAGVCFVPLHPDHSVAAVGSILRELRPALAIVDEDLREDLLRIALKEARWTWRLRLLRAPWLRPVLGGPARKRQLKGVDATVVAEPDVQHVVTADHLPALLLHSSGSTGAPKIIQYTRARLNIFLHWHRRLFDAFPDDPADIVPSPRVNALPLAHFGGLSFVLQGLLDGRAVHLPRAIAPYDYLTLAIRERCRLLMLVPALYEALLLDAPVLLRKSALRYCLTMGEAVTPQLIGIIKRALDVRVYSAYGMSEGLSGLSHHGADVPSNSCGSELFGETRLVDPEQLAVDDGAGEAADASTEREGELWVRNATTFPCYRDAMLNAAKFVDGWYRTGDRFRRDAQGHHYFLGRVDAMCVANGRNVYPADVEQVLLRHPEVSDCMAAALRLDKGRQRFGVMVCLRADSTQTAAGLIDWFLVHGALYATPAWLLLAKGIPRNAAGKRDRLAVAALLQQDYERCLRKVS